MSFNRWFLLLSVLVYFTAAWFGVGYHAEDEFQQVILVAEHVRGNVEGADMPIDFLRQWRGMLLPMIAAGVFEVCESAGIRDPFTLTLLLRLLTAAVALWVMHGFTRVLRPTLRSENRVALDLLSWFLWFVPVLLIRFSGEAWSALLFVRGLTLLLDEKPRSAWAIGAWWAIAVVCRPAVFLLPVGALLWLVLVKKEQRARLVRIIGGGAMAILFLIGIDSLLYRGFTFSLLNYGIAAITGEEAARFIALPAYQHALFVVKYATPPVAALMIAALVTLIALDRKHPLLWLLLPYFIVHSLLLIKEPRFLYPLAPLLPWLLVAAWDALTVRWPAVMAKRLWLQVLFPFAAVNAMALLIAISTPAGNGRIKLAQAIHAQFGQQPVHIDQLGDWRQRIPPFFLALGSTERFTEKIIVDPKANGPIHLVIAKQSLELDHVSNLHRMATATPSWTDRFLGWYHLEDVHDPLVLYVVTTRTIGH
jgi:GPI mannosyltransferase 3